MGKDETGVAIRYPTRRERKQRARLEQLLQYREIDGYTVAKCAELLDRSERATYLDLKSGEYAALVEQTRAEWKEAGTTRIGALIGDVVSTMESLMHQHKSEHARFEAAKALGDWYGLGVVHEESGEDGREEIARLTKLIEERTTPAATQNNYYLSMVGPGGFLNEPGTVSEAGKQLQAYIAEDDVVDGSITEDDE